MNLIEASHEGNLLRVRKSPPRGEDPNIVNRHLETSLHEASGNGYSEVIIELLSAPSGGADPTIANKNGETPLILASRNRQLEIIDLIKSYFASLQTLSIRSIRKYRINIIDVPLNF